MQLDIAIWQANNAWIDGIRGVKVKRPFAVWSSGQAAKMTIKIS